MVFIYPLQQLLEGRVASLGDFYEAKQLCNSQFKEMVKDMSIDGVIFYSPSYTELHYSDAEDYYTSGTRLGFVAALNSCALPVLQKLHELEERAKEKNVGLEPAYLLRVLRVGSEPESARMARIARVAGKGANVICKPDASGLGPSLIQQLKDCSNKACIIGNNPLSLISPRAYSHEELVDAFAGMYSGHLTELVKGAALPKYGEGHCQFLENLIQYTLLTTKEMLFLKNHRLPKSGSSMPKKPISDKDLVGLYLAEFGEYPVAADGNGALSQVLNLKTEYRAFIDKFLKQGKSTDWVKPAKYTGLLDRIADAYGGAKAFIEENIEIAERMPGNGQLMLP
jgi:hypothetical protein